MSTLHTPVLVSLDPDQLQSAMQFINEMRKGAVPVAAMEAERLDPYWDSFSRILQKALKKQNPEDAPYKSPVKAEQKDIITKEGLIDLFNGMARDKRNAILSEVLIAPEELLDQKFMTRNSTKDFEGISKYKGYNFNFGFIQLYEEDKSSSVTVPFLGIDARIMAAIAPFNPGVLLKGLQQLTTAGNHDMTHHFANARLNPAIADTATPLGGMGSQPLYRSYFEDAISQWMDGFDTVDQVSTNSQEAWLMLNHARIRRLMEDGPEGQRLQQSCEDFFDELSRIGQEIAKTQSKKTAHDVVNFLGVLACHGLSRFMPLDHPLMERAITRLREADPDPAAWEKDKVDILNQVKNSKDDKLGKALEKYGTLSSEDPDDATAQKLQIALLAPWVALILSPPKTKHDRETIKDLDRSALLLVNAVAQDTNSGLSDGVHEGYVKYGPIKKIIEDGVLHREDGPALIFTYTDLYRYKTEIEEYYLHGVKQKIVETKQNGDQKETHYKNNRPYYFKETDDYGCEEKWLERDGRKHEKRTSDDGWQHEAWYTADSYRDRADGPAYINRNIKTGYCHEQWYKNGKLHRIGKPADIEKNADGSRIERWYENGELIKEEAYPAQKKTPKSPAKGK